MSQIFEALQQSNTKAGTKEFPTQEFSFLAPDAAVSADVDTESLGQVPVFHVAATPDRRLVAWSEERTLGAEKIRTLVAKLRHVHQQKPIKKILITSSISNEGKSLISANLAITLAKPKQERVLLIDGDCRRPSLAKLLGASVAPGLANWWIDDLPIASCMQRVQEIPLWLLAAGKPLDEPLEMLQSSKLAEALAQLVSSFDWIIIDSPPIAPLADAGILATLTDSILLVVRQGTTPKKVLAKVLDSIEKSKLLGVVLNESTDMDYGYYKEYIKNMHQKALKATSGDTANT
jgi:protein-tyrosine kinase